MGRVGPRLSDCWWILAQAALPQKCSCALKVNLILALESEPFEAKRYFWGKAGSSFTILPVEVLEAIGCDPATSKDHLRLITGNGIVIAPRVTVAWLHALGREIRSFPIVAYTIPFSEFFDGLLWNGYSHPPEGSDPCVEANHRG